MKNKGGVIISIVFAMISFTVGYHVTREKTTECPDYWLRIGTGCYLFAIPEILQLDESCKLDGKVDSRDIRKSLPFITFLVKNVVKKKYKLIVKFLTIIYLVFFELQAIC